MTTKKTPINIIKSQYFVNSSDMFRLYGLHNTLKYILHCNSSQSQAMTKMDKEKEEAQKETNKQGKN